MEAGVVALAELKKEVEACDFRAVGGWLGGEGGEVVEGLQLGVVADEGLGVAGADAEEGAGFEDGAGGEEGRGGGGGGRDQGIVIEQGEFGFLEERLGCGRVWVLERLIE